MAARDSGLAEVIRALGINLLWALLIAAAYWFVFQHGAPLGSCQWYGDCRG